MSKSNFSRRKFIASSLLTGAGLSLGPQLSFANTKNQASLSTVKMGFIGVGRQAMGLLNRFMSLPQVEVIAAADVYDIKLQRFVQRTHKNYADRGAKAPEIKTYEDYQELLANPEIDAVVIATPDHWHAKIAIDACKAKKDIYLEKPLTFTVFEGQELVKAVRENSIILAVGSMQRSAVNFQTAVTHVQKGNLGKLTQVLAHVGDNPFPKPYDLPKESIPAGLNWEKWTGPISDIPYNPELNPPISLQPEQNEKVWGAWRWYEETGGGLMTDWGAHMIDVAQWGMGMDRQGPVAVIPPAGDKPLIYRYSNGLELWITPFDEGRQGVKFIGEKGWIKVSRGNYDTSIPELALEDKPENFVYDQHYVDFIESIHRRKDPIVPVEIGHSSCTTCTIGNIAHKLNRPLQWDPAAQNFGNDYEANTHLHYTYQHGISLL
ncbi:Gfo/Idh/MocA family protein [Algoriphagus vanfongensis]|uniref:Gfo/Idh/MocA family protein n=1 Tax=Algoriphagus vanfongensis TaxID=426371 RepID=UPI0003F6BB9F|nr:Gfo/Idh/MocA family oxidoreductase [Algoriphagus vanfongensis]